MQAQSAVLQLRAIIQKTYPKAVEQLVNLTISRKQFVKDAHLEMNYCLSLDLGKKLTATSTNNSQKKTNPFLNPESSALFISKLGNTHNLLFNKFNIFKNHLIVATQKFQSQNQKLNQQDFNKATLAFLALKGLLFFNGGDISGASQPHKHLQILPQQAIHLPIFTKVLSYVRLKVNQNSSLVQNKTIIKFPHFNFLHGIIAVKSTENQNQLGIALYEAYNQLYNRFILRQGEVKRDYNLIACKQFVACFVRKQQFAFNELSVNSVGYLGSVLFKNQQMFERFLQNKNITPSSILQEISFSDQP